LFFWKRKKENSSSSEGWSKKSRDLILLFAGLSLTLSAVLLARQRIIAAERDIHRKVDPVDIVVPSVPVPAGAVFTEQNLAKKSVPSSGTSSRNVPAAEFELLIGAHAKGNLASGEPILWTDVEEPYDAERFSQIIPAGRRALTLETTVSSSFAGLIRPGDSVDLLCEKGNGKGTQTWIRAIPVMSVDRYFGRVPPKEGPQEVSTITVSVTPEEGRLLAIAVHQGRIQWFLRNPDESSKPTAAVRQRTKHGAGQIEIWKAGIQEIPLPFQAGEKG
jgi:pilus assembly protein CpaB